MHIKDSVVLKTIFQLWLTEHTRFSQDADPARLAHWLHSSSEEPEAAEATQAQSPFLGPCSFLTCTQIHHRMKHCTLLMHKHISKRGLFGSATIF